MSAIVADSNTEPSDEHLDEVSKIISSSVKWSAVGAIVPIPLVDMLAIAAVQVQMIRRLANVYGHDADEKTLHALITALLGTITPVYLNTAVIGSTALKFVPAVGVTTGSLFGTATMAGLASASTYAIGKIFVRHFEKGGTIRNFSVDDVKSDLKSEFSNAKKKT
jgi:uncharacterized protein (DUF697 family)